MRNSLYRARKHDTNTSLFAILSRGPPYYPCLTDESSSFYNNKYSQTFNLKIKRSLSISHLLVLNFSEAHAIVFRVIRSITHDLMLEILQEK